MMAANHAGVKCLFEFHRQHGKLQATHGCCSAAYRTQSLRDLRVWLSERVSMAWAASLRGIVHSTVVTSGYNFHEIDQFRMLIATTRASHRMHRHRLPPSGRRRFEGCLGLQIFSPQASGLSPGTWTDRVSMATSGRTAVSVM